MFHSETAYPEHPQDMFIRGMTRYMIWETIEQEATEFPGKAHYKQGEIRLSKTRKQLTIEGSFWRMDEIKENNYIFHG